MLNVFWWMLNVSLINFFFDVCCLQLSFGDLNRGVRSSGLQNNPTTTTTATATGVWGSSTKGGLWEQFKKELAQPRPTRSTGTTTTQPFLKTLALTPASGRGQTLYWFCSLLWGRRCSGDWRLKKREDINITQTNTTKSTSKHFNRKKTTHRSTQRANIHISIGKHTYQHANITTRTRMETKTKHSVKFMFNLGQNIFWLTYPPVAISNHKNTETKNILVGSV